MSFSSYLMSILIFLTEAWIVSASRHILAECDAMVYGTLLRGLQELDLWPRKPADIIKISVHKLALQLQSLVIFVYPANDFSDHFSCNFVNSFKDRIALKLRSIHNAVLASHRRHMRIQARK